MFLVINLTSSYSYWFFPLCILIGWAAAYFFYFREEKLKDTSRGLRTALILLRGISISLLLILLLEPTLKSEKRSTDNPIILVAKDNSSSLRFNNDSSALKEIDEQLAYFKNEIGGAFELKFFSFGSSLGEGKKEDYSEKETDFNRMLEEINQRFLNRNVGALIVLSDGIYNRGVHPLYSGLSFDFPIHTIGLGDTLHKKDAGIRNIRQNEIAYLGNTFPLIVEMEQHSMSGEEFEVVIKKGGTVIRSQKGQFSEDVTGSISFELKAEETGVMQYEISIKTKVNEANEANNKKFVFIDVLDGRQKIVVLANAPHPDLGAISAAISVFEQYSLETVMISDLLDLKEKDYDLVILHQLPSLSPKHSLIQELVNKSSSVLFITGVNIAQNYFNDLNTGLRMKVNVGQVNEVKANFDANFNLFELKEEESRLFESLPPLNVPFGEYDFYTDYQSLYTQKIGAVKTEYPLYAFNTLDNKKYGYILGEGLWKWRLWAYKKTKNHEAFNQLIGKTIQYLSVKSDRSRLRISNKNSFLENEQVQFAAEYYNESYELVNTDELEMVIYDSLDTEYDYAFSKSANAYQLNVGLLAPGEYRYKASVRSTTSNTVEKTGRFLVQPIQLESFNTVADYALLFNLSQKYGGKFFTIKEFPALVKELKENDNIRPITKVEEVPKDLINIKLLFFIILSALSLEWFLRKRNGAY